MTTLADSQKSFLSQKPIQPDERLIFAMDVPTAGEAKRLVEVLGDAVKFYKLGLQIFMADGYYELIEWLRSRRIRAIPISYGDAMQLGSNVVALGNERVLVPASSKNLIAACRAEGLRVYDPDVSMIGNGGGAVHCMCQALKRDPADGR